MTPRLQVTSIGWLSRGAYARSTHRDPRAAPGDGLSEPTPPHDLAEDDVLKRGRASQLDVAWLGVRQFLVKALARIRELRPRELNLSWITDALAVGGAFRPQDVRRLHAQG